jgi:hypothetical protein
LGVAAAHIRTDDGAGNGAARGRIVAAPAVANLVTEHPADQGAGKRACRAATPALRRHLLAIYPAALLILPHDSAYGRHACFIDALVRTATVFIVCLWQGSGRFVVVLAITAYGTQRGDAVVQTHAG